MPESIPSTIQETTDSAIRARDAILAGRAPDLEDLRARTHRWLRLSAFKLLKVSEVSTANRVRSGDLTQVGWIKLVDLLEPWDPALGHFLSYASMPVKRAMRFEVMEQLCPLSGVASAKLNHPPGWFSGATTAKIEAALAGSVADPSEFPIQSPDHNPVQEACTREERAILWAVLEDLGRSDPESRIILESLYGLWGLPARSVAQISQEAGRTKQATFNLKKKALAAARWHFFKRECQHKSRSTAS